MSWTRRFLVAVAFGLMLAGVALMVAEKEEVFLALSVAGFLLVLAAVPSLQRDAGEAGESGPPARDTARGPVQAGTRAAAVPRAGADPPTLEQQGESEAPPEAREPAAEAPAEAAEAAPAAATDAEGALSEGVDRGAHDDAAREAPAPTTPPTVTEPVKTAAAATPPAEWRAAPRGASDSVVGRGSGEVSPRSVAVAGVAAGALVLLWRRLRR